MNPCSSFCPPGRTDCQVTESGRCLAAEEGDLLHPFAVGDLVETTTPLTCLHVAGALCPANTTLQIVGLSGNPEYPISVCKPDDRFWRCGVRLEEIRLLQPPIL